MAENKIPMATNGDPHLTLSSEELCRDLCLEVGRMMTATAEILKSEGHEAGAKFYGKQGASWTARAAKWYPRPKTAAEKKAELLAQLAALEAEVDSEPKADELDEDEAELDAMTN